jgi:hypothetical protein
MKNSVISQIREKISNAGGLNAFSSQDKKVRPVGCPMRKNTYGLGELSHEEYYIAFRLGLFGNNGHEGSIIKNATTPLTYDVYFNDENSSNNKGFNYSFEDCMNYIETYNGTEESYFKDYKGGTVSIFCNKEEVVIFETEVI